MKAAAAIHLTLLGATSVAILTSCRADRPVSLVQRPEVPEHPVLINQPAKLTAIETATRDPRGVATSLPCQTCHSMRADRPIPTDTSQLQTFHQGLKFTHGTVTCASCHVQNAKNRHSELRLADGRTIPMTRVMDLCAQCHGPQFRDYRHGSHGGMTGYWDRRRGPRRRNNCVDCHDPHAPQIPQVRPVLPPRDRFLPPHAEGDHE